MDLDVTANRNIALNLHDAAISPIEVERESLETRPAKQECPDMATGFRSSIFAIICLMAFSSSIQGYFFNGAWKYIAQAQIKGLNDIELSSLLTIGGSLNSISRLVMGLLNHYLSFKFLYTIVIVLQLFLAATILSFGTTYPSYAAYLGLAFFCEGSHICLFPTMMTKVFGLQVGARLYPLIYQCFSIAILVQFVLYSQLGHSYSLLLTIFSIMGIIAFTILHLFFIEKISWETKPKDAGSSYIDDERIGSIGGPNQ